jgi:hypothetical protein
MEFLASLATRVEDGRGTTRRRMESAFNALRLARQPYRFGVVRGRTADHRRRWDMAGFREDALRTQLTTEWTSVRGAFDTRYDGAYSRRLADRAQDRSEVDSEGAGTRDHATRQTRVEMPWVATRGSRSPSRFQRWS